MNGVVSDDVQRVRQSLKIFTSDPVSLGLSSLEARLGRLESETNPVHIVLEKFRLCYGGVFLILPYLLSRF